MDTKLRNVRRTAKDVVREFILDDHPCVMAQSVVAEDRITVREYGDMSEGSVGGILHDIQVYLNDVAEDTMKFQTFVATFSAAFFKTEIEFERRLWGLLNALHRYDNRPWDSTTSHDPNSPNFSFSLLGSSFYIIGMHPMASRLARSSPVPMIVFNLHSQFERLRNAKRYIRVRNLVRRRDKAFQGAINPMLQDFGTNSEARQYSGRAVESDWKCPFNFDN